MDHKSYEKKIAFLESKLDMREAELSHVDEMLKRCGFPEGIVTLKDTMSELLFEMENPLYLDEVYKKQKGSE